MDPSETPRTPADVAASMPLDPLVKVLNQVGSSVRNPNPTDPEWMAFRAVSSEFHRRMAAHYATVSDKECVAVLTMTMREPWAAKSHSAQIVADAVENELRARFSGAAEIADAFLDGTSLDDSSVGEYDHLRVLLDSTGITLG